MDNLPDGITLDMLDDCFTPPAADHTCSGCGVVLYEEEAHELDGAWYCDTCFIDKAITEQRYCTDCGAVGRKCFTTSFNDEPYCPTCLQHHVTNLGQLGRLCQQGLASKLPLTAPVLFTLDGDSKAVYAGIQELVRADGVLICLAPVSEKDLALLSQSYPEQES